MTYTLTTFAVWLITAAVCGLLVGWFLHRGPTDDDGALEAMHHAELQNEQLRLQLAQLKAQRDRLATELADTQPTPSLDAVAALEAEREYLQGMVEGNSKAMAELRVRLWNAESEAREVRAVLDAHLGTNAPLPPDVAQAAVVLQRDVVLDDLTLVLGVSPAASAALIARGITTWWVLANADVELLRQTVASAGVEAATVDPSTWPHQARLLALGQWDRYKTFVDTIRREGLMG